MRVEDARRRASGEEEAIRARLARERAEAMGTATSGSSDGHEEDDAVQKEEADGGILGSVVLPVLDSVSPLDSWTAVSLDLDPWECR